MEMDQKSRGRSLSLTQKFYHLVQSTDCERKPYSLAEIILLWGNPLQECSFHSRIRFARLQCILQGSSKTTEEEIPSASVHTICALRHCQHGDANATLEQKVAVSHVSLYL